MRIALLLASSLLALAPRVASAQDDSERAREHFAAGQALAEQERFDDAYAQFAAGYALSQRPLFLFNMAECAHHQGDSELAVQDYQRYLEADPEGRMAEVAHARLRAAGVDPVAEAEAETEDEAAEPDLSPEAAAATVATPVSSGPETETSSRRTWPIWVGVGAAVVAAIVGTVIIASVAGGGGGAPSCSMPDCQRIDWQ